MDLNILKSTSVQAKIMVAVCLVVFILLAVILAYNNGALGNNQSAHAVIAAPQSTEDSIVFGSSLIPLVTTLNTSEAGQYQPEGDKTPTSNSVEIHSVTKDGKTTTTGSVTINGVTKDINQQVSNDKDAANNSTQNLEVNIDGSGMSQTNSSSSSSSSTSTYSNISTWHN